MKKLAIVGAVLFLMAACTHSVRVTKTDLVGIRASGMQTVKLTTENGFIKSAVWSSDSIHIVLEKWATGTSATDAEDHIPDIKVYQTKDTISGVFKIEVDVPDLSERSYGCNITVNLPESLALEFESSNGEIVVENSIGGMDCHTSNGAISLENTRGAGDLETSNGKIDVKNHTGELSGTSSNGDVSAEVILPRGGDCILKTSNGKLTLAIPDTTSAMIDAITSNGKIEIVDLSVTILKLEQTEFKGKMGDGAGTIQVETSNGDILLKKL